MGVSGSMCPCSSTKATELRAQARLRRRGYPRQVAIGDIDGDARPDLVTATYGGGTFDDWQALAVLINRGDGTFGRRFVYAVRLVNADIEEAGLAVGVLNGDGRPDVVDVESGLNAVSVLRNAPGLCDVPDVRFAKLRVARQALARANCRVGKVRWAKARPPAPPPRGWVLSKPVFGAVLGRRARSTSSSAADASIRAGSVGGRRGEVWEGMGEGDESAVATVFSTERRRSRTYRAVGYTTAPVLKTSWATGPMPLPASRS